MGPEHSEQVAKLASELFSQTAHVHGLTKTWGPIVTVAAFLQGTIAPHTGTPSAGAKFESLARRRLRTLSSSQRRVMVKALQLQASPRRVEVDLALRVAAIVRLAATLAPAGAEVPSVVAVEDDGKALDLFLSSSRNGTVIPDAALVKCDFWNAVALRPIRSIRYLQASEDSPKFIRPEHSVSEAARRFQQRQLDQFVSRVFGLEFHDDVEYVHEMRVALRRLRALLRLFRKELGKKGVAFDAELRQWAQELGTVRDLDVFMLCLQQYAEGAPDAHRPFLRKLIARERANRNRHRRSVITHLRSEKFAEFRRRYCPEGAPYRVPLPVSGQAEEPILLEAPRLILKSLGAALKFSRPLRLYAPEELHRLRIRCKRVRYTAEFLHDLYPDGLAPFIQTMRQMQDLLGDVHDLGTYTERIREYCRAHRVRRGTAAFEAATALLDTLARRQAACLRNASTTWRRFTQPENLSGVTRHIQSIVQAHAEPPPAVNSSV